ncbi:hypothetical protein ACNKHL_12185 [Shigella flexneri]
MGRNTTNPPKTRAFGRFTHAGSYTTTITRLLSLSYLNERLTLLYLVLWCGSLCNTRSMKSLILMSLMALDSTDRPISAGLTRYFPTTELARIGDETADGITSNGIPPVITF